MEGIDLKAFDERNKKNYYYCIVSGITSADELSKACGLNLLHAENVIKSMERNGYMADGKIAITPEEFVAANGDPESYFDPNKRPPELQLRPEVKPNIDHDKIKEFLENAPKPPRLDDSIKIIGMGNVGLATLSQLAGEYAKMCCAISNKKEELEGYAHSYFVESPVPEVGEVSDGGLTDFIDKLTERAGIVIISTCACGCAIAAPVAKAIKALGKTCIVVATQPHTRVAAKQIALLKKSGAVVTVFEKDKNESKADAAQKHCKIITDIASLVVTPMLINVDLGDLICLFKDKTEFTYCSFTANKSDFDKGLAKSTHTQNGLKILNKASASILLIRGSTNLSLTEINSIIEIVNKHNKKMNMVFGADVRENVPDDCLVSIIAVK